MSKSLSDRLHRIFARAQQCCTCISRRLGRRRLIQVQHCCARRRRFYDVISVWQIWRELDSLLSADEFVKSNERCCDDESSSRPPDGLNAVSLNLAVQAQQQQQAIDVRCNVVDSALHSGVFDSPPLFPSITVRNDLSCDFTMCCLTSRLPHHDVSSPSTYSYKSFINIKKQWSCTEPCGTPV